VGLLAALLWSSPPITPEAGLRLQVLYAGHEPESEAPLRTNADGLQRWSYALGQGIDRLPAATGSTRSSELTLSGGMMGSNDWTINGKVHPHTDPVTVHQGDLVQLQLFNMSMQNHPMHLHGHSFHVLEVEGQRLKFRYPLIKDVVNIDPMQAATIQFVADNPGPSRSR
jgi:multicopper oxidase